MGRLLAKDARKLAVFGKEKSSREIAHKAKESKVVRTFFLKLTRFALSGHSECYTTAVPQELFGQLSGYNFKVTRLKAVKDWQGDLKWIREDDFENFNQLIAKVEQINSKMKEVAKRLERGRAACLRKDAIANEWAEYRYGTSLPPPVKFNVMNQNIAEVGGQYLDEIERLEAQADALLEKVQPSKILGKINGNSLTKLVWGRSDQGYISPLAFDKELDAVFLRHICGTYVQGILNDSERRIKEQADKGQSFVVFPLGFCNRPSPAIFARLMRLLGYTVKNDSASITVRWG